MTLQPRSVLFVLWEGGGNVPPILALARRLVERGHAVRVMSDPCNEAEVTAAGCTFVPYTLAPHRHDKSRDSTIITDWEAPNPTAAFALLQERLMFGPALAFAKDVLAELERQSADLVAINDGLYGGMIAAEKAGVPQVVLMPNCYLGPARGLQVAGLRPMPGPIGRVRDAIVGNVFQRMVAKGLPALNAARTQIGLAPLSHPFDQLLRADRVLVLTSPAFDFPAAWLPSNVRYVGPQLDDPAWVEPWKSPWPSEHPQALVVVSLSTTFQNQVAVLQRIMDALAELPFRGLVTLGPTLDAQHFHAPENVVIRASAPHAQVFPHAAAVVTHAGHGTVIRALAHGVPLVCIPMGRDQHDNAVRVEARGAGLRFSAKAQVPTIRTAIRRVVEVPSFREHARQLARAITADARRSTAIEEVERLAVKATTMDLVGAAASPG
jgi:MGT family glycosyltransferase